MAIAFDAASSDAAGALSWSHTTSGTSRILFVGTAIRSTSLNAVTGITYNGVALTKINHQNHTAGGDTRSELWYLVAPATGTNTVAVTFSGTPTRAAAGAITLTGVNQFAPIEASATSQGNNASPSVSVTSVTNDAWAVASMSSRAATAFSPGTGETEAYDVSAGTSHRAWGGYEGPKTPAGTITINPTAGSNEWTAVAAAVKPVLSPSVVTNTYDETVATYYFDGSSSIFDENDEWTGDANAFDGSTSTFAINGDLGGDKLSGYLEGVGTNAPGTGDTIIQVRARVYYDDGTPQWGAYATLDAPGGSWTWTALQGLIVRAWNNDRSSGSVGTQIYAAGDGGGTALASPPAAGLVDTGYQLARVEIEVTSRGVHDFGSDTTPTLEFTGTDADGDDIRYNIQIDTVNTFDSGSVIDKVSNTDPGFANTVNGLDTDPFTTDQKASYTVQSALSTGTYYYRVRGLDPSGTNTYGAWSDIRAFTVTAPSSSGKIKVYNGSSFVAKPVKVWNGSAWVTKPLKRYNGTSWVETNY